MSNRLFPPLLFWAAFLLTPITACKKGETKAEFKRTPLPMDNIQGVVVTTSVLESAITAGGTLLPFEQTELHPEVAGRVVSINLPEGKRVSAGTLLVKLFDEDLTTQIQRLDAQLAIARTTAERLRGLLAVKGVSQQEYDLAELQTKNLEAEIALVRVRIRQTEIRAPYNGVIGLRQISPGAYITPQTAVATIRDDRQLRLDFSVPEKYGPLLKSGQSIQFTVDGSQRKYNATVQASEQSVNADTRDLQLRALVRDQGPELSPGRFAEVDLSLTTQPKAMLIPSEAIIPQAKEKKVVVCRDGKAKFTTVVTGVRQSGRVEVISGLSVGDTIVTAGLLFLRPDAPFKFSKVD